MIMIYLAAGSLMLIVFLLLTGSGREGRRRLPSAPGSSGDRMATSGSFRGRRPHQASSTASASEPGDRLLARIVQAGLYGRGALAVYTTVRVLMMVLPVLLGILAARAGWVTLPLGLVYGCLAGVIGTVAPSFWLDYLKAKRQSVMRRALPDAMDVIVVCVEAGLSVSAALSRVSKELQLAHPMLSAELTICQREIQMGATTGEALRRVAERFDLEELRTLACVIQQAERFGASIVHALRVHADALRQKRFQRGEELAQRAAVKLVFPTILCIFPALFLVLAGPAVQRIFEMFKHLST